MEQHWTRQQTPRRPRPQNPVAARNRQSAPAQRSATSGPVGVHGIPAKPRRRVPPASRRSRRLPNPRFTGLGAGLFATATMLFIAYADQLLLDGEPLVYGALFLPVSAVTALWVRTADLVTAPISAPIAFAVGTLPIAGGTGGVGGHAMALITSLAVHAGWLYGGTLVAGLIASVRKVREMGRRQRIREAVARTAAEAASTRAGIGTATGTARAGAPRTVPVRTGTAQTGTARTGATAYRATRSTWRG
ncbi:DUF6542 domain-containing protein [Streptomyces sp. NPDC088116]|uniref:DUF6542 domain-containing protein n=1 Tax=Streptomyces sp. NPDC088116 TaxID=3365825 RepID=UPI00382F8A19